MDVVSSSEARRLFNDHVNILAENQGVTKTKGLEAVDLMISFLEWIEKKQYGQKYISCNLHCTQFANYEIYPGTRSIDLPANQVRGQVLETRLVHRCRDCFSFADLTPSFSFNHGSNPQDGLEKIASSRGEHPERFV